MVVSECVHFLKDISHQLKTGRQVSLIRSLELEREGIPLRDAPTSNCKIQNSTIGTARPFNCFHIMLLHVVFLLVLLASIAAEEISTSSKRLLFPDLSSDLSKDVLKGSKLKLAIVIHRDAARTPTTERYLPDHQNWTHCSSDGKSLHAIKIVHASPGGTAAAAKLPHEHKPLPGGCRMGVVTDVGMAQVHGTSHGGSRPWGKCMGIGDGF